MNEALVEIVESEIDREPSLLSRERGKAATLIEGAVDRSSIYRDVESNLDVLIAKYLDNVELGARIIRRKEIGDEQAEEEQKRGSRTDEEYARVVASKRTIREKTRIQEETKKRREEEIEKLREKERKAKLDLEHLRREDERKLGRKQRKGLRRNGLQRDENEKRNENLKSWKGKGTEKRGKWNEKRIGRGIE